MTKKQQALFHALDAMEATENWQAVVDATNALVEGIQAGEDYYDSGFPPELERSIDVGALRTAWIYDRLESAASRKGLKTRVKIRRALGYHTH